MIAAMKKLTLAALKSDIDKLCSEIMWLEAVETSEFDMSALPEYAESFGNDSDIYLAEQNLQRLKNALDTLSPYGSGKKKRLIPPVLTRAQFESLESFTDEAFDVAAETERISKDIASARAAINKASNDIASFVPFESLDEPLNLDSTAYTSVIRGTFPKIIKLDDVKKRLDETGFDYELVTLGVYGDFSYVLAVVLKQDAAEFLKELGSEGFSRILPFDSPLSAAGQIEKLKSDIENYNENIVKLTSSYRLLAEKLPVLEQTIDYLSSRLEAERIKQKLISTDSACILTGWVPEYMAPALEKKLSGFECCYSLETPAEDDKVPVKLLNRRLATPFESVLGLYSYPDYHGVDPTFVMSIFYFIIFGLIMQDVLYGLILLFGAKALASFLRAKDGSTMKKMLDMFSICGISTIICGVLFGGYFGNLPSAFAQNILGIENFPNIAVAFDPVTNPMPYLFLSLGLGAVHLVAGLLMKAYMLIKSGQVLDAVFDVGLWLVLFAGIGLLAVVPEYGKWVALIGAAGLVLTQGRTAKNPIMKLLKGVMSLYDIVGYVSDLLSYSRIMALGLSGAIIAQVVNLIGTLGDPTVVGFIALILAIALGHTLNLALSLLGAFVHTARLQYIEFFGKFYIDGGEPFKPASVRTKYTQIIKEEK